MPFSLLLIAVLAVASSALHGGVLRAYVRRGCQGRAWRRAFPGASKSDIRDFLTLFADAFALRRKHRLKFGPDDTVLSIYQACNPHAWLPDALELETLATNMQTKHGLLPERLWNDGLTLGQLFAHTRRPA